jgi:hypothetical protein
MGLTCFIKMSKERESERERERVDLSKTTFYNYFTTCRYVFACDWTHANY